MIRALRRNPGIRNWRRPTRSLSSSRQHGSRNEREAPLVLPVHLRALGIGAVAAIAAVVLALAFAPVVKASELYTEQEAPFVMEEHLEDDDDDNGVLDDDDDNGVLDDDEAVDDDDDVTPAEPADENGVDDEDAIAPAETGTAGLVGSQAGTALGVMLLALGAMLSLVTLGRFATRRI